MMILTPIQQFAVFESAHIGWVDRAVLNKRVIREVVVDLAYS